MSTTRTFRGGVRRCLAFAALSLLSGCVITPYAHISDPTVNNDSFEFGCVGAEYDATKTIKLRGDGCVSYQEGPRHERFARVWVEYRPFQQRQ